MIKFQTNRKEVKMSEINEKVYLFDPGYAQHTTILSINLEYIYLNLSQYRNLGQKKMQFKMVYPKILKMVDGNVGFCLGSLLWAAYLKSEGDVKIEGNPCLGGEYDEAETVEEADFSIEYFEQLRKDAKYYLGQNYEINSEHVKVVELYKEFITLNKGFTTTRTSNDIILPASIYVPAKEDAEKIYTKIQEVIKSGNLLDLFEVFGLAYKG